MTNKDTDKLLEVADRIGDLRDGIEETIELKIPINVKLYWSKKNHNCKSKWWSDNFMKDAIEYEIDSLVENAIENSKKQIEQEINNLIDFCEKEGIPKNEIFQSKEYTNKMYELYNQKLNNNSIAGSDN